MVRWLGVAYRGEQRATFDPPWARRDATTEFRRHWHRSHRSESLSRCSRVIEEDITVYRSAKTFPPGEREYVPAADQPGRVIRGNARAKRASRGLSVFTTAQAVRKTMRRFPELGQYIVRYHIPRGTDLTLTHLLGEPEHLTLEGSGMLELAGFLDASWQIHISGSPDNGGEDHG